LLVCEIIDSLCALVFLIDSHSE